MVENSNPSVVNDASGGNFGGILDQTNLAGAANNAYLENLWELAQKATPKQGTPETYRPAEGDGIRVGSISNQTLGSVDLFAAGLAKVPFGMLDMMAAAKQQSEANYYKEIKTYLDKPIADLTAKLANPFAQKDFSLKLQGTVDAYLDAYASKFGGDYMKAYAAATNDPNLARQISMYQNYADGYNMVFKDVLDIIKKAQDTTNHYVPPETLQAANRFLQNHGDMKDLSIDQLAGKMDQFRSHLSVYKTVDAAMTGFKDSAYESYPFKDANLSTAEEDAYITKTVTGKEGEAQVMIDSILEANPWMKNDPAQKKLVENMVQNRMKHDVKYAISKVKKENADRTIQLSKYGLTDDKGNVQFKTRLVALVNLPNGTNAVTYPKVDKPIPSTSGMFAYFLQDNVLRYGKLPGSYAFTPVAEYDVNVNQEGLKMGRYVEGKMLFQTDEQYTPVSRSTTVNPQKGVISSMSETTRDQSVKTSAVRVYDELSKKEVEVFGEVTVLTHFDMMRGQIESTIPHMNYVHEEWDKRAVTIGGGVHFQQQGEQSPTVAADKSSSRTTPGSKASPISLSGNADISSVQNSPDVYYQIGAATFTGKELHDRFNAK